MNVLHVILAVFLLCIFTFVLSFIYFDHEEFIKSNVVKPNQNKFILVQNKSLQFNNNYWKCKHEMVNPHVNLNVLQCDNKLTTKRYVSLIVVHARNWGKKEVITYQNQNNISFFIEIFSDGSFQKVQESNADCKIALLVEPPSISPEIYLSFKYKSIYSKFDSIFTYENNFIEMGKPFLRTLFGGCWVLSENEKLSWSSNQSLALMKAEHIMSTKITGITEIFSNKRGKPAYDLRHLVSSMFDKRIIKFGAGTGTWIPSKRMALEPYQFSIIIENGKDQGWYFSEKLIDCLVMLTVPIYWSGGNSYMAEIFDMSGFILFSTVDDLNHILNSELATEELQRKSYNSRKNAILCNFKQALWFLENDTYKNLNYQLINQSDGSLNDGVCCHSVKMNNK